VGVIISFSEDGYVKDDDAAKIDYGELLASMQKATLEANPERAKAGYAQVELVGWAEPPSYDSVAISSTGRRTSSSRTTRRIPSTTIFGSWAGAASLCSTPWHRWIGSSRPADMAKVIGFVEFSGGHRYADFIPGTDKVAEYGIAALIAGGLAAKAGLFKGPARRADRPEEFIVLGLVAAAAFLRRLFGRKSADAAAKP